MTGPPGLQLAALEAWLDRAMPGLRQGSLQATLVAGGKSNLTYRVTDGYATWALRRPPLAHVLPTAHDMVREYRIIDALTATAVPVAPPVALCEDPDVLGRPFYMMGFVDGVVLSGPDELRGLSEAGAARVCEVLVDTLAALHAVDHEAVGLARFGRPDGYLQRQIARWHKQWLASQTRELRELEEAVRRLEETRPAAGAATIVHGDYRLTNVIYTHARDQIAAVVDWELSTLGDPLADLGLFAAYQQLSLLAMFDQPSLSAEDGFWTVPQIVQRYAEVSGRDVRNLDWYLGLAYFKLAVIAEGIHHRYLDGMTVGAGFDEVGAAVPWLAQQSLDALG